MKKFASLDALVRKYPAILIVMIGLLFSSAFTLIEQSGVLPLEGQAMPMYGAMPVPRMTSSRASSRSSKAIERKVIRPTHPAASRTSSAPSIRARIVR